MTSITEYLAKDKSTRASAMMVRREDLEHWLGRNDRNCAELESERKRAHDLANRVMVAEATRDEYRVALVEMTAEAERLREVLRVVFTDCQNINTTSHLAPTVGFMVRAALEGEPK